MFTTFETKRRGKRTNSSYIALSLVMIFSIGPSRGHEDTGHCGAIGPNIKNNRGPVVQSSIKLILDYRKNFIVTYL